MLSKLLKYDIKNISKIMLPIYIGLLLISLLSRGAYFVADKIEVLEIPYIFIFTISILAILLLPFATIIIGCIKFYNNLIKDEGYLMNTLPVKKSSLILSKLISSTIMIILSLIISLIATCIGMLGVYFTTKNIMNLLNMLDIFRYINNLFIVLLILSVLITIILNQLLVYLAITLGQRHNKNKGVMSFVYVIVIYYLSQIITSVILVIPMYISKNITDLMKNNPPIDILNIYIFISLVINIIISTVYFIISKNNLEKNLNLD